MRLEQVLVEALGDELDVLADGGQRGLDDRSSLVGQHAGSPSPWAPVADRCGSHARGHGPRRQARVARVGDTERHVLAGWEAVKRSGLTAYPRERPPWSNRRGCDTAVAPAVPGGSMAEVQGSCED